MEQLMASTIGVPFPEVASHAARDITMWLAPPGLPAGAGACTNTAQSLTAAAATTSVGVFLAFGKHMPDGWYPSDEQRAAQPTMFAAEDGESWSPGWRMPRTDMLECVMSQYGVSSSNLDEVLFVCTNQQPMSEKAAAERLGCGCGSWIYGCAGADWNKTERPASVDLFARWFAVATKMTARDQ